MFNGDVAFQRLWRRITSRYPFASAGAPARDAQAVYTRHATQAYDALKALGDERVKLERDQLEAYFFQLRLLPPDALGAVCPGDVLAGLVALPLPQAWRWFCFGLHRSPAKLGRYLARQDDEAEAVFAGLAKGVSGFEHERVLRYYADALAGWGGPLRFLPPDSTAPADPNRLSLPDRVAAYPDEGGGQGVHFLLYKWLITHAQAHRQAGTYRFEAEGETQGRAQLAAWIGDFSDACLIEVLFHLFEDVRVEAHLLRQYPGFAADRGRLMALEFACRPEPRAPRARWIEGLLQRLHWGTSHIQAAQEWREVLDNLTLHAAALAAPGCGVATAAALAQRAYEAVRALYPDPEDESRTLGLLPYEGGLQLDPPRLPAAGQRPAQRTVSQAPLDSGDDDVADPDAQIAEGLGLPALRYDEWDFRDQRYRARWCALREGQPPEAEAVAALEAPQVAQVRRAFEWMAQEDWARHKHQLEGDEIDLDAWVEGAVDRRAGQPLPEKLYSRALRSRRDLCAAILLDQSDSTARLTPGGQPVIGVERQALRYLCEALDALRDDYAIYTYSGEGRGQVDCFAVKPFALPNGHTVQRRLEALRPLSQNRDGCALRHLTRVMRAQSARTKLLLHVTDGRPWDHGYHQKYALEDTKRAVQEARAAGVKVFGVVCDPHAPASVRATYGPGRCVVLQRLDGLSELLLGVYRKVTR